MGRTMTIATENLETPEQQFNTYVEIVMNPVFEDLQREIKRSFDRIMSDSKPFFRRSRVNAGLGEKLAELQVENERSKKQIDEEMSKRRLLENDFEQQKQYILTKERTLQQVDEIMKKEMAQKADPLLQSQHRCEQLEKQLKESEDKKKGLQQKLEQLERNLNQFEQLKKQLEEIQIARKSSAQMDEKLRRYQQRCEQLEKQVNEAESTKDDIVQNTDLLQQYKKRCEQLEQQLKEAGNANLGTIYDVDQSRRYQQRCEQLEKQLREAESAKNDALSRLSRQKMTEGNAAIADLSDKDRPTKLAERYHEIYENVWTDSLGSLTEERHESDSASVEILLNILMDCFDYCSKTVEKQTSDLYMDLLLCDRVDEDALPSDLKTLVKDAKKASGSLAYKNVFKAFKRKLESGTSSHERSARDVEKYVQECFEVCWQMCLRDPPLVIAPLPKPGDRLESDFYNEYTVSGSEVDYVVWPALLLHRNGPLLAKGVVKAKKDARQRSKTGRERRSVGLYAQNSSLTPPTANTSEQTLMNRNTHIVKSYPALPRKVPDVPFTTKINSQTDQSASNYSVEQTNHVPTTTTWGGSNLNYSPGSRITKGPPAFAASSYHDRPQNPPDPEAAVRAFASNYHKYGYEFCKSAYGEKRCNMYHSAAAKMGLL